MSVGPADTLSSRSRRVFFHPMSRMVPPKRQHEPSTSLIKDAIQIDHDSNLFFVCFPEGFKPDAHQSPAGAYYCGTDEYVYRHFFADFGPLHLGHIHLFCSRLGRILELQQQEQGAGKKSGAVYVYSSDHPHRRSNAAVLVLAFAVSLFSSSCGLNVGVLVHRRGVN